jgi:hypothetical protein
MIKLAVRQVQPVSQLRISLQDTSFDLGAFSEPWELEADTGEGKSRTRSAATSRPGRTAVERQGNTTKVLFWAHVGNQAETTLQVSCQAGCLIEFAAESFRYSSILTSTLRIRRMMSHSQRVHQNRRRSNLQTKSLLQRPGRPLPSECE